MKVYEDSNKKKSVDSMNMLGLDIKKIQYEIPLHKNKQSMQKIDKIGYNYSANPRSQHHWQHSPLKYAATSGLFLKNTTAEGQGSGKKLSADYNNNNSSSSLTMDPELLENMEENIKESQNIEAYSSDR